MTDVTQLQQLQNEALGWLISIHDATACGCGWLAHIPPNEQNTAEVVVAFIKHAEDLNQYRRLLINCIKHQLLTPKASVTKDWIWVAYALITVKAAGLYPDKTAVDKAIANALREVDALYDQRDGGWPDSPGEPCQVTWTALTVILLNDHLAPSKVAQAVRFLARAQNADGGWGPVEHFGGGGRAAVPKPPAPRRPGQLSGRK
jgi:hypothetical protein